MKLLWLCNMAPSAVQGLNQGGGLWIDHVLSGLQQREDMAIRILYPGGEERHGSLDARCSFASFGTKRPYQYLPELETLFGKELERFQPDAIHIWGTECAHTLAMVNACLEKGLIHRVVVSIQGLCSVIARHYTEGIPDSARHSFTFRDFVRQDNILQQQKKFALRGELEIRALQKVQHVIGRTDWDEACVKQMNPQVIYHFCNETLREPFYEGKWSYKDCSKHRIFASSCSYPVKGFHYLLEAFTEVLKAYPDAKLAVPGSSFMDYPGLRKSSYQKYLESLCVKHGMGDRIEFLGSLTGGEMKNEYLKANVFVLPSTIENSPNSLGEAMLLGVPCVASDVGGVTTMLKHGQEGYVYPSTAPYMLAHDIMRVFAMEEQAEALGSAARKHAGLTHDPEKNLQDLLNIYRKLEN